MSNPLTTCQCVCSTDAMTNTPATELALVLRTLEYAYHNPEVLDFDQLFTSFREPLGEETLAILDGEVVSDIVEDIADDLEEALEESLDGRDFLQEFVEGLAEALGLQVIKA